MTDLLDLRPAADELTTVVENIRDEQLASRTPCPDFSVAALLDHTIGFANAFRSAALKEVPDGGTQAPTPSAANLDPYWRTTIPPLLDELCRAWQKPEAWEGEAEAGGVTMPAAVMGVVALNEMVMHGWDLARATGQPFNCEAVTASAVFDFCAAAASPEEIELRDGIFGPVVPVADSAAVFDRALGFAGRNPAWTP